MSKKNDFIITKPIFDQWNEKIIQNFNVHMCIDCYHIPMSFRWYATLSQEWLGKFICFLQAVMFICFIWIAPEKRSSNIIVECWFITEYHFHPMVHMPCLSIFSPLCPHFLVCVSVGFSLTFLSINLISFS